MWRRRRLQKKRSGKWGKIFWIIPAFLIIAFLYLFFKSGIFNIKQVEVQDNQLGCTDGSQIRNLVTLVGQNFFLMDSQKIEDNLKKKFYCINSILIKKYFPSKVRVEVLKRLPVAIFNNLKEKEASISSLVDMATPSAQQIQDSFVVDGEGVVFSKDTSGLNVPGIYIYDPGISLGKRMESNLVKNSLKILERVKQMGVEIKESWIFDNFFVINSEVSKLKIIFRLDDKLDIQLASLQLILDKAKIDLKELEFIDLRFDKPVIKVAPEKDAKKTQ